jgi:hypothetical protein
MSNQLSIETYKKKYAYELSEVHWNISGYAHPIIEFYEIYKYNDHYSKSSRRFQLQYQCNIENGNHGPAYGGNIENLGIDYVEDLNAILKSAQLQKKKLEIYGKDALKNMISALRAAGYRKIVSDDHYIYNVE